jgi:hypothetical protein
MFKILLITIIFIMIFAWEIPQLRREKERKELVLFSLLGIIGYVLNIMVVMASFL